MKEPTDKERDEAFVECLRARAQELLEQFADELLDQHGVEDRYPHDLIKEYTEKFI